MSKGGEKDHTEHFKEASYLWKGEIYSKRSGKAVHEEQTNDKSYQSFSFIMSVICFIVIPAEKNIF